MNKPRVRVASPGTGVFIRQAVLAYYEQGMLEAFYTTLAAHPDSAVIKLMQKIPVLKAELKRRMLNEVPLDYIDTDAFSEILRSMASRFMGARLADRTWEWSEQRFDRRVAASLDYTKTDILHCFEHASLASIREAKRLGMMTVYEQPSAHHRFQDEEIFKRLFAEEPVFAANNEGLFLSRLSDQRNARRDEELMLADLVICNSAYVKRTLVAGGVSPGKVEVIPLGFPEHPVRSFSEVKKIRFIVSGNLSYQKGVHHLLRLWRSHETLFRDHELFLVGSNQLDAAEWQDLPGNIKIYKRLPQEEYFKILESADVLILNTYSDGFGMIMSEAMAKGLVVIGTANSAAPELIEEGVQGFVIEAGNSTALLQRMQWLCEHPQEIPAMKSAAQQRAAQWKWKDYRYKMTEVVTHRYREQHD
jgi:hypothetical protein